MHCLLRLRRTNINWQETLILKTLSQKNIELQKKVVDTKNVEQLQKKSNM